MGFTPTESQQAAVDLWQRRGTVILVGPPGSGKTHTAVALAASTRLPVTLTRPMVYAERERLGALPGDLREKVALWQAPFDDAGMKRTRHVEWVPLGVIQGRTIDGVLIVDGAQNATAQQIDPILGRVGRGGRCIFTGDPDQSYISDTGFVDLIRSNPEHVVELTGTQRSTEAAGMRSRFHEYRRQK